MISGVLPWLLYVSAANCVVAICRPMFYVPPSVSFPLFQISFTPTFQHRMYLSFHCQMITLLRCSTEDSLSLRSPESQYFMLPSIFKSRKLKWEPFWINHLFSFREPQGQLSFHYVINKIYYWHLLRLKSLCLIWLFLVSEENKE